jgi:hypothetical protein
MLPMLAPAAFTEAMSVLLLTAINCKSLFTFCRFLLLRAFVRLCVCAPRHLRHCRCHLHPPLQPLGFALEGHPTPAFNGAYRKVSEHKGWPVLRNGAGMFCYRYEPYDQWLLNTEHTPDSEACASGIVSVEGPLPSGAQTWRCYVDGKWVESSLSVTVLVRPFPSLPWCPLPQSVLCPFLYHIVLSCHPTIPSNPTPAQPKIHQCACHTPALLHM